MSGLRIGQRAVRARLRALSGAGGIIHILAGDWVSMSGVRQGPLRRIIYWLSSSTERKNVVLIPEQMTIGAHVRTDRPFAGVPARSSGVITSTNKVSCEVAWDHPQSSEPSRLSDGFSLHELRWLSLVADE